MRQSDISVSVAIWRLSNSSIHRVLLNFYSRARGKERVFLSRSRTIIPNILNENEKLVYIL